MNIKSAIIVVLAVILTAILTFFIIKLSQQEVVFVRSHDMIYAYEGTKEAIAKFEVQKEVWNANIDTLAQDFKKSVEHYKINSSNMSEKEKIETENILNTKQAQLKEYGLAIDEKIQAEDQRMMQEVLNQINSFSKEYGKQHGYALILGTTLSGNVLYGSDNIDITDEFLEALNKHYRGE